MAKLPLRLIRERQRILSARHIPEIGFGSVELTDGDMGSRITERVQHAFRLMDGCIVTRFDECGVPCPVCRNEFLASMSEMGGVNISGEQLDWLSTPCRFHQFRCEFGFCGEAFCARHGLFAPDGHVYCERHFIEITDMTQEAVRREKYGVIGTGIYHFVRSLFLPE